MTTVSQPVFRYGGKPPALSGEKVERFVPTSPYGPQLEGGLDTTTAATVLTAVRDGWESARQESFEGVQTSDAFYGLVVFGSLVKGRFHKGSDVDGVLLRKPMGTNQAANDQLHECAVQALIQSNCRTDRSRYAVNLFGMTMNIPIALTKVQKELATATVRRGDEPVPVSESVQCLFHLAVGSGEIPQLRKRLLDGLGAFEGGDIAWRAIAQKVIGFEEYRRQGRITLPDTVAEAKDYFEHIELERQLREDTAVTHP